MFADIPSMIARLRPPARAGERVRGAKTTEEVHPDAGRAERCSALGGPGERSHLAEDARTGDHDLATAGHPGNVSYRVHALRLALAWYRLQPVSGDDRLT
jgi:hypothetical protein